MNLGNDSPAVSDQDFRIRTRRNLSLLNGESQPPSRHRRLPSTFWRDGRSIRRFDTLRAFGAPISSDFFSALWSRSSAMKRERKSVFDPKAFLAKANGGRTISKYQKDQIVFSQGEPADSVFYIQEGKIKITVVSEQGKEAVVAIL